MKKLYIKQKVFSIGEKFTVTDDLQNPRYYVEGSFFKIPKSFTIFNEKQRPIAEITKKSVQFITEIFCGSPRPRSDRFRKTFHIF